MHNNPNNIDLVSGFIDDYNIINLYFSINPNFDVLSKLVIAKDGRVLKYTVESTNNRKVTIKTEERLGVKSLYYAEYNNKKVEIIPHKILDNREFFYEPADLGLTYYQNKSSFKVFAPTANEIILNIYDSLEQKVAKQYNLSEDSNGVWSIILEGDFKGKYYSFCAGGKSWCFDKSRELVDPYSFCVIGNTKRSLIVDLNSYPKPADSPKYELNDLVIYEIHLKDLSMDETSGGNPQYAGKYLSLTEDDTFLNGNRSSNVTTMLNHFKDLGVNTIQIMPLQDFDNNEEIKDEYHWGYMPKFFNTLDGSYSTDWKSDSKIVEAKKMVDSLHKNGMKVILDIVYNHTAEGIYGNGIQSFNGFVPYFYYRISENGYISNGSGCGNELRSEAPMCQKFVIDSMKFLTSFYGFDGYRFDLMGLFSVHTIDHLIKELKEVRDDIIIYGEPWAAGATPLRHFISKGEQRGKDYAFFNDEFRDAIKGSVFDKSNRGYVQSFGKQNSNRILNGILGSIDSFALNPTESINYVEVHDNNTLFDKLVLSMNENEMLDFIEPIGKDLEEIILMHKLSAFLLFVSQGIPLLHLGQDFMVSKQGIDNSYNAHHSINKIDWNRKRLFYNIFLYHKNLITIRKLLPFFKYKTKDEIKNSIEIVKSLFPDNYDNGISYIIANKNLNNSTITKVLVIINPYKESVKIKLPNLKWKKLLLGDYFFEDRQYVKGDLFIGPISGNILVLEE